MAASNIRLGTAPDSWGVWFAEDPRQLPWTQFLDEAAAAGYEWIELGPYGYLPTDPEQLRDELGRRGLRLSGGAVFAGLHHGKEALAAAMVEFEREAKLLTALDAKHVVFLPEGYTDLDGTLNQPRELTAGQWADLVDGMNTLARACREDFGVDLVFHSHADSHVGSQAQIERFLADTDPQWVGLCLDTGHVAYYRGSSLDIVRRHPDRIGYVHLKQVDPAILDQVEAEGLCFAEAVRRGVMCEPPGGAPEMAPLLAELEGLGIPLFGIVEQDLFPCEAEVPFPIAKRTREFFNAYGVGPSPAKGD